MFYSTSEAEYRGKLLCVTVTGYQEKITLKFLKIRRM